MARLIDCSLIDFLGEHGQLDEEILNIIYHLNIADVPACFVCDVFQIQYSLWGDKKLVRDLSTIDRIKKCLCSSNIDVDRLNNLLYDYNKARNESERVKAFEYLFEFMKEYVGAEVIDSIEDEFVFSEDNVAKALAVSLKSINNNLIIDGNKKPVNLLSVEEKSDSDAAIIRTACDLDYEFAMFVADYPADVNETLDDLEDDRPIYEKLAAVSRLAEIAHFVDFDIDYEFEDELKKAYNDVANAAMKIVRQFRCDYNFSGSISAVEAYEQSGDDCAEDCLVQIIAAAMHLSDDFRIKFKSAVERNFEVIKELFNDCSISISEDIFKCWASVESDGNDFLSSGESFVSLSEFIKILLNDDITYYITSSECVYELLDEAVEIIKNKYEANKKIPEDIETTFDNFGKASTLADKGRLLMNLICTAMLLDASFNCGEIRRIVDVILKAVKSSEDSVLNCALKIIGGSRKIMGGSSPEMRILANWGTIWSLEHPNQSTAVSDLKANKVFLPGGSSGKPGMRTRRCKRPVERVGSIYVISG